MNDNLAITICVVVCALVLGGLFTLMGLTTHASHIRDLNNKKAIVTTCLENHNSADACRILVYGTQ